MANDKSDKPRGRTSSYAFFVQKTKEDFKKKNPSKSLVFAEFSKSCSEQWKKMGDDEKKKFVQMAEKDKKRYDQEMSRYVPPKGGKPARKAKKDPNAPKRALSAFFLYCGEERQKVRASLPADSTVGDISKELGKKWKALSETAKQKYVNLAAKDKLRYEKEIKAYKAKGGAATPGDTRKTVKTKKHVESSEESDEEEDDDDDNESNEEEDEEEDDD